MNSSLFVRFSDSMQKAVFYKKPWFKRSIDLLMQCHPIVLLLLGYMDAQESFLVLALSYLSHALFIQVKMGYGFWYDMTQISFPKKPTTSAKVSSALGYLIGFVIVLFIWLFIYLIYFALMYDAVTRSRDFDGPTIWEGANGSILIRTMLINAGYFIVADALSFRMFVKNYRIEKHDLMRSIFLNVPFHQLNKWNGFPLFWFLFFWAMFIFLLSARAFEVAIISFFVFDIGFILLKGLEKRRMGE